MDLKLFTLNGKIPGVNLLTPNTLAETVDKGHGELRHNSLLT